ncbi:MAG TPA: hypothetical protein EYP43_01390 [Thermoplasmata archaeon]|nr:hypothetical protein [Thermoplasmata archaeon]
MGRDDVLGLSLSVAAAIIFSAVVIVAADFIVTYDDVTARIREAVDARDAMDLERSSTLIDVMSMNRTGGVVRVNVTNEGTVVIDPRSCDILIDGVLLTGRVRWNDTRVLGHPGSWIWGPGETVSFSIGYDGDARRVIVITPNGASGAYMEG